MSRYSARVIIPLFAAMVFICTGCSPVTTMKPLSDSPQPVDKEKFEGTWMMDKEIVHIRFDSKNVARIAGVGFRDDAYYMEEGEMIVTAEEKGNLISVRFREDGKWMDKYYLARYSFPTEDYLLVWLARPEFFETAVNGKKLKGTAEKQSAGSADVTLTGSSEEILKFIREADPSTVFELDEPMILRKLSSP